jgi:hypothetical protein
MDGLADEIESHRKKALSDWENNTTLSYIEYYAYLNINPPVVTDLGGQLTIILTNIVDSNEGKECSATPFLVAAVPPISIEDYVARIVRYSMCSPEAYVLAVVYIDKYHRERENTCLSRQNIHK